MWRRVWIRRRAFKTPTFSLCWYDDFNHLRSESVGTSLRIAQSLRRQREMELNSGLLRSVAPKHLKDFRDEHLAEIAHQVAPGTLSDQRTVLNHLIAWAGNLPTDRITRALMDRYIGNRSGIVRPATVNREIRTLKSVFTHAVTMTRMKVNPLAGRKMLREERKILNVITARQVEALLAAAPSQAWRTFIYLALTTGFRSGELAALRWTDVDFDSGIIIARCSEHHLTKGRKERLASLVAPAAQQLSEHRRTSKPNPWIFSNANGDRWGKATLRKFKHIRAAAGIRKCTIHDLRKTFCSHLAMAGVGEAVIQDLAGHANIQTTRKHYTAILPESLRAAPLRLPWVIAAPIMANSCRIAPARAKGKTA